MARLRTRLALLLVLTVSGCATQPDRLKITASGYPEATFQSLTVADVRNGIIGACDSRGLHVVEANDNAVVCGKTMSGGEAVLAQFLIGNSYSTTPQQKIRFTIYQLGTGTKVSARQWIETQMAFGQVRAQELNSNQQFNDLQSFLYSIGGDGGGPRPALVNAAAALPNPFVDPTLAAKAIAADTFVAP